MSKIDEKLISKLEKLARLKLSTTEKEQIQGDLNKIVEMFDKLQEVDTEGVEPLRHINIPADGLREDEVQDELKHSEAMKNASQSMDGFFVVPKFLHKD